ncbi:alpha/beta fold hydrolase [Nonomuraea roseoviolacea]|uniref:Pimeloyl-ACP methyl ester carboxylesterase n=1 Tax=Nonomuraea roseoviolacea subsp. carminata TaxID=160689 RepID=A0ABT1K9B8_9ACTN|nr:alpha/beta hydrolase [Nonomuraea roseoviolacea]MCP2350199.1 pimeloyl-ACP methyl ester carboxylesterase [Nonomuraea roseoviolacea subsp. carminata]
MFFETSDGTRLAYEDYGQGRPIVFVASAMLCSDMWEYQIPYFVDRGYRCIALDRRGHGRSDRPSTGYDMDTAADDLAVLIELLDLRDVILVGHSMGGAEIARYLHRHGDERIERIALISAMLPFMRQTDDNPEGIPGALLDASIASLDADRPKWLARQAQAFFATHLGNDVSPAQVDFTMRQCLEVSPWAVRQAQRNVVSFDHRATLPEIKVPTLVVHGAADFSAPIDVTGRRTAKMIPGAVYHEYPTAGHGVFVSHRDQLNGDLLDFIEGR